MAHACDEFDDWEMEAPVELIKADVLDPSARVYSARGLGALLEMPEGMAKRFRVVAVTPGALEPTIDVPGEELGSTRRSSSSVCIQSASASITGALRSWCQARRASSDMLRIGLGSLDLRTGAHALRADGGRRPGARGAAALHGGGAAVGGRDSALRPPPRRTGFVATVAFEQRWFGAKSPRVHSALCGTANLLPAAEGEGYQPRL